MNQKMYLEYCDEFRKISTLEKLPSLNHDFMDSFQQISKQGTKFMRTKLQPSLDAVQLNHFGQSIRANQLIKDAVQSPPQWIDDQYIKQDQQVTSEINKYQEMSNRLLGDITKKKYKYNFQFGSAIPPERIAYQSVNNKARNANLIYDDGYQEKILDYSEEHLFKKDKYNFNEINNNWRTQEEDLNINSRKNNKMQKGVKDLEGVRTIDEIARITEFDEDFKNFKYNLNQNFNDSSFRLLQDFFETISIVENYPEFNIMYFRDIGLPSRDMKMYYDYCTLNNHHSRNMQNPIDQILQSKESYLSLRLLRQPQLNINNDKVQFYDILNVSTGRINDQNINSCFRSTKITKADVQKLQKKLQKYMKMFQGGGNTATLSVETEEFQNSSNQQAQAYKQKVTRNELINEIDEVYKGWRQFQCNKNINSFNYQGLRKQIINRLENLLKQLFKMVVKTPNPTFSMAQIRQHLMKDQSGEQGFEDKRLLWYILNTYQNIIEIQPQKSNARDIIQKKQNQLPTKIKMIDQKMIVQVPINTTKLYEEKKREHVEEQKQIISNIKGLNTTKSNSNVNNMICYTPKKPKTSKKQTIGTITTIKKDITNKSLYHSKQDINTSKK